MEGVTLQMDFLEIDENKTGFYCKGSYTYSITGTSKKLFRSYFWPPKSLDFHPINSKLILKHFVHLGIQAKKL